MTLLKNLSVLGSIVIFSALAEAKTVKYELEIENKPMNISGKKEVDFALAVNGGIPAPTLEFTEGDDAEILVVNKLNKEEVSIHWHGLLLPPLEDGVAYVNTPPIHAGTSRLFKFKIRQNGTFWYHSHTMLQEQKGVYGALVIQPKQKAIAYDKDAVLVLSDWSDENADQILRNLRKDRDYYLYKKDSVRSYIGAIRAGGLKTHLANEWSRMGGMDLSDVGYDAFLINGKRDSQLLSAHPGEKIRLRIINAAASSYFYVNMGLPMQTISSDGVDIKPTMTNEILIGMAETYDVLFTVPEHKNYEIRATAQDVTGFASAWIGMGEKVPAPSKAPPNMYAGMVHSGHGGGGEHPGHGAMSKEDHGGHLNKSAHEGHAEHKMAMDIVDHSAHGSPASHASHAQASTISHAAHSVNKAMVMNPERAIDWSTQSDAQLQQNRASRDLSTPDKTLETLTVDNISALQPTTFPKDAKVHDVKLVLGGDMERYVWHINGKTIQQDRLLMISKGEVVRFTFQNETMMHHPMHFHGHFFRVINDSGERSPLKHTVDVPPHSSRTIEFFANEPGQWMLHCHNLYHMKTGMARVVRYNDFKLTPEVEEHDAHDPHLHEHLYTHTKLEAASNHAKAGVRLMRTWDEVQVDLETANIDGKNFSLGRDWESEGDVVYRRWFSNFFNVFGGASLYDEKGFGTIGVGYILPLLIDTQVSVNHEGRFRLDVEKRFQWTKTLFSDADFTWRPDWGGQRDTEFEISFMYGPSWNWSAGLMFTEKSAGVGAQIQF